MCVGQIAKSIYEALEQKGFKGSIVSIEHVADLKEEIEGAHKKKVFDEVFYRERLTIFDFSVNKQFPRLEPVAAEPG